MEPTRQGGPAGQASPASGRVMSSRAGRTLRLEQEEEQTPAGVKRIEPGADRVGRRGVDVDGVGFWQVVPDPRTGVDFDLGVGGEIRPRPLGDVRLDLVGDHLAAGRQPGEDRGVIAGAAAPMCRTVSPSFRASASIERACSDGWPLLMPRPASIATSTSS